MLAIVEINDKQHLVKEGDIFSIDGNLDSKKVTFKSVLLTVKDNKTEIGQPYVQNASVEAEVLESGKQEKELIFKFKRKTGYKVLKGHRQNSSILKINKITLSEKKNLDKKTKPKKETTKKTTTKSSGEK